MPDYQVFRQKVHLGTLEYPKWVEGERIPESGRHKRAVDAMREVVEAFGDVKPGASDDFIRAHWPAMRRNHSLAVYAVYDPKP